MVRLGPVDVILGATEFPHRLGNTAKINSLSVTLLNAKSVYVRAVQTWTEGTVRILPTLVDK